MSAELQRMESDLGLYILIFSTFSATKKEDFCCSFALALLLLLYCHIVLPPFAPLITKYFLIASRHRNTKYLQSHFETGSSLCENCLQGHVQNFLSLWRSHPDEEEMIVIVNHYYKAVKRLFQKYNYSLPLPGLIH